MNNVETKQPDAVLIAHTGAQKVSREDLAMIPTPQRTATHIPIPHLQLVNGLEGALVKNGLSIQKEEFAVQTDGMKIFGTFVLKMDQSDFAFALGFRASNDKTISIQLCSGMRVFVCDNMAFSGSCITLNRKHTSGLNLEMELHEGVWRAKQQFGGLVVDVDRMKSFNLKDPVAKSIVLDAALSGVMPTRLVHDVWKNYATPPHAEFEPRTVWSLHNAFTESFKTLRPNVAMESSIALGSLFKIGGNSQGVAIQ